jgi:GNAT superfamily N-acetyltransferase/L-amino acid N-acyltransferase YncA
MAWSGAPMRRIPETQSMTDTAIRIECLRVPTADPALVQLLWHKGSPWVDDIRRRLQGDCAGSVDRFFVAYDGPAMVAHVWYAAAAADPSVGLLGHAFTRPEYRRRGLAARLIEAAMAQFRREGGALMQLFTYNPETVPFYARLGFEQIHASQSAHANDWSLWSPPGSQAAVAEWCAASPREIRPLQPADLPKYCLLYNVEYATQLKDWAQAIGGGLEAELAFTLTRQRIGQVAAACCVLDNGRMIVGAAALATATFPHQSHVGLVDAYVLPQYAGHARPLLDAVLARRDDLGVKFLYAVSCDPVKSELFAKAGLRRRATLGQHYRIEDRLVDLELWAA